MVRIASLTIFPLLVIALLPFECGAADFTLEFFLGGAMNDSSDLKIEQDGEETLEFEADWDTRSFEPPLYWSLRLGLDALFREDLGLELQLIHHKIYLENMPSEVQQFEISHGFNILTLNIAYSTLPITLRLGAGVVVAHTDAVIRGFRDETGYEITGPAMIAGAGRRFNLWQGLFASLDMQLSAASATVTVPEGKAYTSNFAVHFMAGLGYSF